MRRRLGRQPSTLGVRPDIGRAAPDSSPADAAGGSERADCPAARLREPGARRRHASVLDLAQRREDAPGPRLFSPDLRAPSTAASARGRCRAAPAQALAGCSRRLPLPAEVTQGDDAADPR